MSRKDYIALAKALNEVWCRDIIPSPSCASFVAFRECVDAVIGVLKADNYRFDRERFWSVVYEEKGKDNGTV